MRPPVKAPWHWKGPSEPEPGENIGALGCYVWALAALGAVAFIFYTLTKTP